MFDVIVLLALYTSTFVSTIRYFCITILSSYLTHENMLTSGKHCP